MRFFILLMLCPHFMQAQEMDSTISYSYHWTSFYSFRQPDDSSLLDTTQLNIHRYHRALEFDRAGLGNIGLPSIALRYELPRDVLFHSGFESFGLYSLTKSDVLFFQSKRPYTVLRYQQGSRSEVLAGITHAQNITPHWSAGLYFNRIVSEGFYNRQQSKVSNFLVHSRMQAADKRYTGLIAFAYNNQNVMLNGGLEKLNLFSQGSFFNTSLVSIQLDSASATHRNWNIWWQNNFSLNANADSSAGRIADVSLQHELNYENFRYTFYDALNDISYFNEYYFSRLLTRDTFAMQKISNALAMSWQPEKDGRFAFLARGGIRHASIFIQNYSVDTTLQQPALVTELILGNTLPQTKGGFSAAICGEWIPFRYASGSNLIKAEAVYGFPHWNCSAGLIHFSRTPHWMNLTYQSNHFHWSNSFVNETGNAAWVSAGWRELLKLKFSALLLNNPVFFGSNQLPAQPADQVRGWEIEIASTTKWKFIYLESQLLLQKFTDEKVFPFPFLNGEHSLYILTPLFRQALRLQSGIEVSYHSTYAGYGFQSATGIFYSGNFKEKEFYPVTSVFANLKIKNATISLLLRHANQGLTKGGTYSITNYPVADRRFALGVRWQLWN